MVSALFSLFTNNPWLAYAFLFFGLLIEGEAVLFAAAYLVQRGTLHIVAVIPIALAGVLIGDYLWFRLGRRVACHGTRLHRWASKVAKPFDEIIQHRPTHAIIFSKFLYGLNRALLVHMGGLGLERIKFLRACLFSAVLWLLTVGAVAYSFSASLPYLKHYLKYGELILAVGVVGFVIAERLLSQLLRREYAESGSES